MKLGAASARRLDPIRLVEAFYAREPDDRRWAQAVLEALAPVGAGVGLLAVSMEARAPGDVSIRAVGELHVGIDWAPEFKRFWSGARMEHLEFIRTPRPPFAELLCSSLSRDWKTWEPYQRLLGRVGLCDSFAMVAPPEGTVPDLQLHVPIPTGGRPPPPRSRQLLACTASHLASAVRLRHRFGGHPAGPDDPLTEAVLDPEGRLLHTAPAARARGIRGHLVEAVRRMDRARGGLRWRSPEEALALWTALIDGRWSLVDHVDADGRRYVLARRNAPDQREILALSPQERTVLALALEGRSNKAIGYETRLAPTTVAGHLRSCQQKLGVRSRRELMYLLRDCADRPPR